MLTENHLKRVSEALRPTKEHKDKLFHEMIEKSETATLGKKQPISWRSARTAMLAAVVMICLITTTAYTAAYMGLDMKFLHFLSPAGSEQEVYLDNGAYVVNKQAVNEKGTLDVKQIIGDSNLIYIIMDFTAPKGTTLAAERYRFETSLSFDSWSAKSVSYDYTLLDDGNPNDNKVSLVMRYVMTDKAIAGHDVTLQVSNLEGAEAYPDKYETVISGSWETKFKMNYKDFSKLQPLHQGISLYGYEATLSSISTSPISITLKVESAYTKEISDEARHFWKEISLNEYTDSYPITIHFKDGTSVTTALFKGMVQADHLSNTITIVKTFTPIINDKEIESVDFFDTVISVAK